MYWPDNATSKYKLISQFITVNSIRIYINFQQNRLSLTRTLLGLHLYHHHHPCSSYYLYACFFTQTCEVNQVSSVVIWKFTLLFLFGAWQVRFVLALAVWLSAMWMNRKSNKGLKCSEKGLRWPRFVDLSVRRQQKGLVDRLVSRD